MISVEVQGAEEDEAILRAPGLHDGLDFITLSAKRCRDRLDFATYKMVHAYAEPKPHAAVSIL